MDAVVLTEIPDTLHRLARMVVRGFYNIEHAIVIDMLIRNPCMKEDDLVELLKFERKQLRAILAQLKNDKFIKVKLKMETGPDGKTTRQNYYYINYKVFVNVVRYKLDHMQKKIETEERDSTSRSSFKCPSCLLKFTDLEAGQLWDPISDVFRCTFCNTEVEEDESALPKQDSRLLVAKFNEQTEPFYNLLKDAEDIRLAPELLEPEPTDLSKLKRLDPKTGAKLPTAASGGAWSGDATRSQNYGMDQEVTISFGDEKANVANQEKKARPIWMVESTVAPESKEEMSTFSLPPKTVETPLPSANTNYNKMDIMEVLLAHEQKSNLVAPLIPEVERDDDDAMAPHHLQKEPDDIEEMDEDDDDEVLTITVGGQVFSLHEVTSELIAKMTPAEKEAYIKLSQEMYSNIYE
ncbi:hypothetical protein CHUAL_007267 [Chamberlinius hualienensis]